MNEEAPPVEQLRAGQPQPRRRQEMLAQFPAIRQVFHALSVLGPDEDPTDLLAFVAGQEWMRELARQTQSVARLDDTAPLEPGNADELLPTLWQLYAASRVRDILLLAHQPDPADDSVRSLDEARAREQPRFRTVPLDQVTEFFAALGCQPIFEATFDPILHEIVTCEADDNPEAPIQITGHIWPALMIDQLVFTRAGVHVRAGSAHAIPGVADRSCLHWEYWRRHRTTSDGSFWWGHNSQWKTEPRRDYITDHGHVYDFDALSDHSRQRAQVIAGVDTTKPLTADQAAFIKNRCQLRSADAGAPDFPHLDIGIDERHR